MTSLKSRQDFKQKECVDNQDNLNPNLWRNLPHDLHDLVFSYLHIKEICRLQCLNKTWNRIISSSSSFFHQKHNEDHPISFSLSESQIAKTPNHITWVRILDMKYNKWVTFKFSSRAQRSGDYVDCLGHVELEYVSLEEKTPKRHSLSTLARHLQDLQLSPSLDTSREKHLKKFGNCVVEIMVEDSHCGHTLLQHQITFLKITPRVKKSPNSVALPEIGIVDIPNRNFG